MLNHIHLLVSVFVNNPPMTASAGEEWLRELVDIVEMQILMDARAIYCEDLGNEGVTGVVGLTTSHASFHSWHAAPEPFINIDLYSCREFDTAAVLAHIGKWGVERGSYILIDRSPSNPHIIDQGSF